MSQAARNANDGISLAQTAEGALGEIGNNLQRIRELAVQARNATNSDSDRQALNAEVQLLKQEIQRVAEQTNFNGTNLLDGSFINQAFQIGADQGQVINIAQIANANTNMLGSWTSASTAASAAGVVPTGVPTVGTPNTNAATIDQDTFAAATQNSPTDFSYAGFDLNVGGTTVTVAGVTGAATDAAARDALLSNIATAINGTAALQGPEGVSVDDTTGVITNGGRSLSITADAGAAFTGLNVAEATTLSVPTYPAITAGQLTINGVNIEVGASKDAGERATQLVNAINAKSHDTGVTAAVIDGTVQLTSQKDNFEVGGSLGAATVLQATGLAFGSTDTLTGENITKYAAGTAHTGFAGLDISSQADADNAILAMDAALNSINSARADLGAIQNRFSSTIANLNTSSENMSAARSRIRDADYAQETAELTRNQILQQAGTAMLAQANQVPQNVLSLLRG